MNTDLLSQPLDAIHDALEALMDSTRVALFGRRLLRYPLFATRTIAVWRTVPYAVFVQEAQHILAADLERCGPITYAEWQMALDDLCAGTPSSQAYPYAE